MRHLSLRKTALAMAVSAFTLVSAQAHSEEISKEELFRLIQQQQAQIEELKRRLDESDDKAEATEQKVVETQQKVQATEKKVAETEQKVEQTRTLVAETDAKVEATADAVETVASSGYSGVARWFERTTVGGYGEVLFNSGTVQSDDNLNGTPAGSPDISNELDVQRFVLFFNHEFRDDLRFVSEIEIEHTNTGGDGEVELEQAYIEWDYFGEQSVQAGLFLVPVGILNETHEPTTFFGVERNRVETQIIPTTYRVNGLQFVGRFGQGFSYNLGIHEGLQFEGPDDLDIRSARQSGSRANVEEFAATARIKYTGYEGLELGYTLHYQGDFAQNGVSNDFIGFEAVQPTGIQGVLNEAHFIYETGPWEFRGLYARWDIEDEIEEISFDGVGRDAQVGWYLEPAYNLTERLGVFTRYEFVDEAAGSDDDETKEERRILVGANYLIHPRVVVKADVQFENDSGRTDGDLDGFNLGLGWEF